ncbi:MAG: YfjI family protein [Planctomycetaceae bacterium]|nr:YfjI family protein [Planctomycetaceae bacterium]
MGIVASVIGAAWWIELKTGWREPAIIWAVTVATSGSGKSPGLDAATKSLPISVGELAIRRDEILDALGLLSSFTMITLSDFVRVDNQSRPK